MGSTAKYIGKSRMTATHISQIDPDRLGEWSVENAMTRNPGKSRAVRLTRARVKDSLNYFLGDQRIPEASSCKYLGLIIRRDLNWEDQLNYTAQKSMEGTSFNNEYSLKGKQ
jgi:hypothetical protein